MSSYSGLQESTKQQQQQQQLAGSGNKRTHATKSGGTHQKRASFAQQRSASGQSSLSSQGSGVLARGQRRRPAPGTLRRQTSSMDSASRHTAAAAAAAAAAGAAGCAPGASENESKSDDENENLLPSSNADYERIRNETLLFFLDRLYLASTEGKEARTLHDLSCLFGTRDFTREMRQIVGASRNGLKKFLHTFPSLFQIEGDKVYLTQLRQDTQNTQRDYNKEAVDYFKQKLLQFGTSLVPIKNLFGYRSQASQEVRHVSGKNSRDFKRFLRANEEVFELLADGEHVMLKSVFKELRDAANSKEGNALLSLQMQSLLEKSASSQAQQGNTDSSETSLTSDAAAETSRDEAVAMDPYLNKRFALLIEQCLKKMTQKQQQQQQQQQDEPIKVTLGRLHEQIELDCKNELFLKMVKTIDDLKVFLRMHPKIFKRFTGRDGDGVERDFVSLVSDDERRELDTSVLANGASLPYQQALMSRQYSALETGLSRHRRDASDAQAPLAASQAAAEAIKKKSAPKADNESASGEHQKSEELKQGKTEIASKIDESVSQEQQKQSNRNASQQQAQLRANAPPYVPQVAHHQVQRSLSNFGPRRGSSRLNPAAQPYEQAAAASFARRPAPIRQLTVDHRSAIKNYLTRPSTGYHSNNLQWAAPAPRNHQQPTKQANEQQAVQEVAHSSAPYQQTVSNQQVSPDELRARTVDIVREASNIITRIMNTTDAVAFDCKGYNLGFDGQITLIQFGFLPTKSDDLVAKTIDNLTTSNNKESSNSDDPQPQKKPKPEVCVFDLITNPELAYCLRPLLESDKIVKIVHDVRNKSNALYVQFKIILNNVFDTQVANLVIQQQDTGKPAYKSRYISMSKLSEVYGDEELLKYRNLIKSKTRHSYTSSINTSNRYKDVNYWRTRPLTRPMIIESTMDVFCLIGGIYQNLKSKLKPEYEPLFEQLNCESVLARIKPDEIKSAKKGRKIDLEVIDLKRKLYRDATGPIVLSNREIRLLRHIDLTEEVRQKIQQCKKVAKKLERLDMKAQQASQMQISNNQASGDQITSNNKENDPQSLTSSSSTGETSMSTTTTSNSSNTNEQQLVEDEERILSSFMDSSSMFDELKDKMIESSHLLETIEDSLRTPL